ncbi:MAG: hypothetical protein IJ092_08270 [Atopobiaceae bacterium]|nr:hypothetical protein [Atopobiaceae bacterium]
MKKQYGIAPWLVTAAMAMTLAFAGLAGTSGIAYAEDEGKTALATVNAPEEAKEPEEVATEDAPVTEGEGLSEAAGEEDSTAEEPEDIASAETDDSELEPTTDVETATSDEAPRSLTPQDDTLADWTVAIYICGSDLEDETPGMGVATQNLYEAAQANIPDNVNAIVLTGGRKNWDQQYKDEGVAVDGSTTKIYRIENHKLVLEKDYDTYLTLSDPQVYEDFLKYCIDNYPADHMFPIVWDHGGGPNKGVCVPNDDDEPKDKLDPVTGTPIYMSLAQLQGALKNANDYRNDTLKLDGGKFDLIGMDACLMGSTEVCYAMKDIAKYAVVSEELEPSGSWDYYWLEAFNDFASSSTMTDDEKCVHLGKRIVDMDTRPDDLNDVAKARKNWKDQPGRMTLAVVDLSTMDSLAVAVDKLGTAMLEIAKGDQKTYSEFRRVSAGIQPMFIGVTGQVDLYKMCKAFIEADLTPELTSAAKAVIAVVGTSEDAENEEGQLGVPQKPGSVLYRGLSPERAGGIGLAIFFPSHVAVDPQFLNSATNDYEGVQKYCTSYRKLDFCKVAPHYEEYVRELAEYTNEAKTFGGKITANLDDESNQIYMDVESGEAHRIVSVRASVSTSAPNGDKFYLGTFNTTYNKEKGRYEIANTKNWRTINGVPFMYDDTSTANLTQFTMPVFMPHDGKTYKAGDHIPKEDVWTFFVTDESATGLGYVANNYVKNSEGIEDSYRPLADLKEFTFMPLRRIQNEDGSLGDYVAGEAVTVRPEMKPSAIGEVSMALLPIKVEKPSEASYFMSGWTFIANDQNHKEYYSDTAYTLDMDAEQLTLTPIADQTYTGKAIEPEALFNLDEFEGLDIETMQFLFVDYDYRVTYSNNVEEGTATMTVEVISKVTDKVENTLTQTFKIVGPVYSCVEGDGSTWTKGSGTPLEFTFKRSDADETTFGHFTGVSVDGQKLKRDVAYTAASGSVVVTLKPGYLETLGTGEHTIAASFDDGDDATATFTVVDASGAGGKGGRRLPQTGDVGLGATGIVVAGALLVAGGLAVRGKNRA